VLVLAGLLACAAPAAPPARPAASAPAPAAAAIAANPTPHPANAPRTSLTVGLNALSAGMLPLWTAKDAGLFDEYGFDVDFVVLQSSSQVSKVMASGEIPIAVSAAAGVVDAALAGDDQILISSYQHYMNFWVHARPDVRRVADLKDKRIGTTRIGSGAHLGVVELVKKNGLEPDRDVAIMQLGGMPEVYGALTAGAVDAAIFSLPWNFKVAEDGFPLLHDISADRVPYLITALATSRKYASQNDEQVRRFMMAHLAGLARVKRDRAFAVEVLGRNLKSDDQALMERTYDTVEPFFERVPYAPPAAIQTVIDQRAADNPAAASLTPAQVAEDRYVRELESAGFIDRLYR
jgi:ABC-type nitrate/sulfonate/bicarbonate transport system substrate-binding protein